VPRPDETKTEHQTKIAHADMDAFYASVEQRDDPALRGRPVIVGGSSGRGVVAAASYEARVYGIRSAMPGVQARELCPHAVFVRGDMKKYARESKRIRAVFSRFTPVVEPLSIDEAFLDLTGTERLLGPAPELCERLRHEVRHETGLAVSVGLAPVKMVAKIASALAKPDGLLVVPDGSVREFLEPLEVGRIWGIGPVAQGQLARIGVATIGDLATLPEVRLRSALGDWGLRAASLARGEDPREVEPYRDARSYSEENTFEGDVSDPARLRRAIRSHAESVAARLRHDGVRARGVGLKLKLARGLGGGRYPLRTRSLTLPVPIDDGRELARAAERLLDRAGLDEPVRLVGVSATRIQAASLDQLALLPSDAEDPRRRSLNRALDDIKRRFGSESLRRGGAPEERAGLSFQIKRGTEDAED